MNAENILLPPWKPIGDHFGMAAGLHTPTENEYRRTVVTPDVAKKIISLRIAPDNPMPVSAIAARFCVSVKTIHAVLKSYRAGLISLDARKNGDREQ